MALTFGAAARELGQLGVRAEPELRASLADVAAAAIPRLEARSPVDTGRYRDGWDSSGASIDNDAPYASHVHDGLADTLIPAVLEDLEAEWATDIERRLTPRS